jgi:ferredoxin
MRIVINDEKCSGHGRCYTLAPSVFEADETGFAAPRGEQIEVPVGQEQAARLGAASCPEQAIEVDEHHDG